MGALLLIHSLITTLGNVEERATVNRTGRWNHREQPCRSSCLSSSTCAGPCPASLAATSDTLPTLHQAHNSGQTVAPGWLRREVVSSRRAGGQEPDRTTASQLTSFRAKSLSLNTSVGKVVDHDSCNGPLGMCIFKTTHTSRRPISRLAAGSALSPLESAELLFLFTKCGPCDWAPPDWRLLFSPGGTIVFSHEAHHRRLPLRKESFSFPQTPSDQWDWSSAILKSHFLVAIWDEHLGPGADWREATCL